MLHSSSSPLAGLPLARLAPLPLARLAPLPLAWLAPLPVLLARLAPMPVPLARLAPMPVPLARLASVPILLSRLGSARLVAAALSALGGMRSCVPTWCDVRHGLIRRRSSWSARPAATGKTSLVFALAGALGRPLAIFNVDSLRDDTFIELLAERPEDAVLLFEDVDALFRERHAGKAGAEGGGGMTFSTLLNSLDGVLHPRGALVFLTTNHLERLDAALRRPGRVDVLAEVPALSAEQAAGLWSAAFPRAPPLPQEVARTLEAQRVTPARLSELLFALRGRGATEAAREVARLVGPRKKRAAVV